MYIVGKILSLLFTDMSFWFFKIILSITARRYETKHII